MKKLFVLSFIMIVGMQNLFTQNIEYGFVIGKVVDSENSKPLPGTNIRLKMKDQSKGGVANKDGDFEIKDLLPGDYDIHFSMIGYQPFIYKNYTIKTGENDMGTIFLEISTIDGEDITVTANRPYNAWSIEEESAIEPGVIKSPKSGSTSRSKEKTTVSKSLYISPTENRQKVLKAAAHNDNEEYPFYIEYLNDFSRSQNVYIKNLEDRLTLRFIDQNDDPLWNIPFKVTDKHGTILWEGLSYANGENVLFPHTIIDNVRNKSGGNSGRRLRERNQTPEYVIVNNGNEFKIDYSYNRLTTIKLPNQQLNESFSVEILFIIDATGSMGDEIQQLKDNLYSIYTRINNSFSNIPLRFGLVEYRDKKDEYVTKVHQFTDDINQFQLILDNVKAKGGGDTPEDIQSALDDALHKIKWNENALKLSFLVADARPHIDYNQEFTYIDAAIEANKRGIKLYTIGASGLDRIGEYVFRQISALTYSEFIFLTYGESGESDGTSGKGKVSHHTGSNYSSRALDDLVVDIIRKEVSYQLPENVIVHDDIKPENQESFLRLRMNNLWTQINKQIVEITDGATVGLIPIFETARPELNDFANYLQNLSIELVLESGQMTLVERERLEEILKEHGLSMAGIIDDGTYGEIGKLTKADIVFLGSIDYAGIDRVVMVRGVRLKDSRIIAAARVRI